MGGRRERGVEEDREGGKQLGALGEAGVGSSGKCGKERQSFTLMFVYEI